MGGPTAHVSRIEAGGNNVVEMAVVGAQIVGQVDNLCEIGAADQVGRGGTVVSGVAVPGHRQQFLVVGANIHSEIVIVVAGEVGIGHSHEGFTGEDAQLIVHVHQLLALRVQIAAPQANRLGHGNDALKPVGG